MDETLEEQRMIDREWDRTVPRAAHVEAFLDELDGVVTAGVLLSLATVDEARRDVTAIQSFVQELELAGDAPRLAAFIERTRGHYMRDLRARLNFAAVG